MAHEVVVGARGACVMCGWPVRMVRTAKGYRSYVHASPVPPKGGK